MNDIPPNSEISLIGRMGDWGPFPGEKEGQWVIFSIGNPQEGHGYALPLCIDDLQAQRVAHLIACKTGARYAAHIPWATDGAGDAAKDWAPFYIPVTELVNRLIPFLRYHLDLYQTIGYPANKVLILSGHGGNNVLAEYRIQIQAALGLETLVISHTDQLPAGGPEAEQAIFHLAEKNAQDPESLQELLQLYAYIILHGGHADHMEHSMGAALDVVDWNKLDEMNHALEDDFEEALKNRWPPVAGLGGFLLRGGKYVTALGSQDRDKFNLWNCLQGVRELNHHKIIVRKELGEFIFNYMAEFYANIIRGTRPLPSN